MYWLWYVDNFLSQCLTVCITTTPERLRDVLIHELCHAATWILDGVKCGHGAQWKNWWVSILYNSLKGVGQGENHTDIIIPGPSLVYVQLLI